MAFGGVISLLRTSCGHLILGHCATGLGSRLLLRYPKGIGTFRFFGPGANRGTSWIKFRMSGASWPPTDKQSRATYSITRLLLIALGDNCAVCLIDNVMRPTAPDVGILQLIIHMPTVSLQGQ